MFTSVHGTKHTITGFMSITVLYKPTDDGLKPPLPHYDLLHPLK